MNSNHENELKHFLKVTSDEIATEYERVRKRTAEDPGTAGDEGEENWAGVLRSWLPPQYEIVTKGRILNHEGKATPQVDVLVLKPCYPTALRKKKLYLAGGVAAAFECKLTLRSEHISSAVETGALIRRILACRTGTPYKELHAPILYGFLAHSHVWKRPGSNPFENISKTLCHSEVEFVRHPRECIDVCCVADVGTWIANRFSFQTPTRNGKLVPELVRIYGKRGSATSCLIGFPQGKMNGGKGFTPIGVLIQGLLHKLGYEDLTIRGIADHFRLTGLGNGVGPSRAWPPEIYSDSVRNAVLTGNVLNEVSWNEWSYGFM